VSDTSKPPYPPDWPMISVLIRARSGGQCECRGECGLHRTTPGPRRCLERDGMPATWAKGLVMLTVAHRDSTVRPDGYLDCSPDNLFAACQRCHLRYDIDLHRWNRSRTAEEGQPRLLPVPPKPVGIGDGVRARRRFA